MSMSGVIINPNGPFNKLIIVRGLPGSGKSEWVFKHPTGCHFEADMYFMSKGGYNFDPSKIKQAHDWCYQSTRIALVRELMTTVSNTFTQIWEMEPYIELAKEYDCKLEIIKCCGVWKNIHNVPDEVLQKMRDRWENYPGEIEVNKPMVNEFEKRSKK